MELLFYEYKICTKEWVDSSNNIKRTSDHHHDQYDNCPTEPNRETRNNKYYSDPTQQNREMRNSLGHPDKKIRTDECDNNPGEPNIEGRSDGCDKCPAEPKEKTTNFQKEPSKKIIYDECDNCPGQQNKRIRNWHDLKLMGLSDLSILGIIECFTESAPQLILQLYIMFNMGPQYGMLNHICKYRHSSFSSY